MAYGLPAVVSPVGGIPDAFEDGRHGDLVPPDDPDALADRLGALLGDPERARRMGTQARADAEARHATDIVAGARGRRASAWSSLIVGLTNAFEFALAWLRAVRGSIWPFDQLRARWLPLHRARG